MVEEELAAAIEQIGQARLAVRALEDIGLVDGLPGKIASTPAAL